MVGDLGTEVGGAGMKSAGKAAVDVLPEICHGGCGSALLWSMVALMLLNSLTRTGSACLIHP